MAGTAGRNLNLCFINKIKRPLPPDHQPPSNPLTPDDHSHPFIFKNYNSLYDHTNDSASASTSTSTCRAKERLRLASQLLRLRSQRGEGPQPEGDEPTDRPRWLGIVSAFAAAALARLCSPSQSMERTRLEGLGRYYNTETASSTKESSRIRTR